MILFEPLLLMYLSFFSSSMNDRCQLPLLRLFCFDSLYLIRGESVHVTRTAPDNNEPQGKIKRMNAS